MEKGIIVVDIEGSCDMCKMGFYNEDCIGKTVFLAREEAEAKLKVMEEK